MKRLSKIILVLSFVGLLGLSGCQQELDKADLVGRYECESINKEAPEDGVECYLEIIDEESYTLVYNGHGYAFDFPSTYEVKGDKLFLSGFYDGKGNATEQEALVEGNTITYKELQTDYEYVFKK